MRDRKSLKDQCILALATYLQQGEWYKWEDTFELTGDGAYRFLGFQFDNYNLESDSIQYSILVKSAVWQTLVDQIHSLFHGKIRSKLLRSTLGNAIRYKVEHPVPFSNGKLGECCDEIADILLLHFETQAEALVPVFNIHVSEELNHEIPLGRATFCAGGSNSMLAKLIDNLADALRIEQYSDIHDCNFLRVRVSGDQEHQYEQAKAEAETALSVLRFITVWRTNTDRLPRRENPAAYVSQWRTEAQKILFYIPPDPVITLAHTAIMPPLTMAEKRLDMGRGIHGLDDLNYHFEESQADNPISQRVQRALALYESGTQATNDWEALYRYVVCVEIALSTTKNEVRTSVIKKLNSLIFYGEHVGLGMRKHEHLDAGQGKFGRKVQSLVNPLDTYYGHRNDILHGNDVDVDAIAENDVEDARELAHNTVRLLAKFARKYSWNDKDCIGAWFENGKRIAKCNWFTEEQKIVFCNQVELLRAAAKDTNVIHPTQVRHLIGRLNRLLVHISKDRLDRSKLGKVVRELEDAVQALPDNADVSETLSDMLATLNELRPCSNKPNWNASGSDYDAHSNTN